MTVYFLVEGETEERYINMQFVGKVKKVNLWNQKDVAPLLRQIKKDDEVIIIADTDVTSNQERFVQNIAIIKKHCKNKAILLILQNKNFEDELRFSCGCTEQVLLTAFNVSGIDKFKNQFIKERMLSEKLTSLNDDIKKMWTQGEDVCPHELKNYLVSIEKLEKYRRNN